MLNVIHGKFGSAKWQKMMKRGVQNVEAIMFFVVII